MHFVYILFSAKVAKYYVGESAFPDSRLIEHNTGKYKQAMTKIATDWVILHLIACTCRTDALKMEKYIKSMKSKKFIEKLITDIAFRLRFKEEMFQKFAIIID